MRALLSNLRLIGVLILAFMVVAVDFTSYVLSVVGDLFFVGALVVLAWPALNNKAASE
ncbi:MULTISPECIES: DUF3927 family protein [Serratia]|uniref:DUF3927 domain-containing protein n=1 Tax=Serratia proteamaculans TaxID=28151 RepID=A0A5Q2VEL4_SERPR|nr:MULTISPECIES: DUF3927 family protein [Serratia]MBF8107408.1 DUF3927 family protein [Serratia liquefaciens]QGH62614.1 DUF3927 domain-containing protein [Serratia proteamaculans]RYM50736.1 DUF3927 domain-containing protein [Serratia proteamaculans]CAI1656680.1 Uncharacterised protein [Serratia liquefaciens]SUI44954.1 Uncharacterised protein [Serratia liquefaciens]